jgi:two-component system, OmpR family, response regulator VanR
VLLVEDEPYMADAIRAGLRLEAIATDIAADGAAALELLGVNAYDIAVLDEGVRASVCEAEGTEFMCQSGSRSPKWILRAVSAGVQERADLHFVSALSMAR